MKGLFGLLLMLSLLFFAFMQWGGALTGTAKNGQTLAELNPDKVKLLDLPALRTMPASAVQAVQAAVAVSAPLAVSAPALVSAPAVVAPLQASVPLPVSAPVITAPEVKAAASKTCLEWGEFSGTDLAGAEKELSLLKLGDRLAQRTVEYESGYWVYIPPLRNKAAVNKKIAEIKAAGVEDYFVLKESQKWNNAISLGVFKTEEAAKKFQLNMKKKGLRTAKVGERKHKLKYIVFLLKGVEKELAVKIAALQKNFPNSELKAVACNNQGG